MCIPLIDDPAKLPPEPEKLKEIIVSQDSHLRAMAATIEQLQRRLYGKSSEKQPQQEGQQSFLADAQSEAQAEEKPQPKPAAKKKKGHGRRPIPKDLPRRRVEHDVLPEEKVCSCGCEKKKIGEETSEQLEFVPAELVVLEHVRFRYACPNCRGEVVEAAKPFQAIDKGLAGPGLLSQVIVSKYADHLPLCRQEGIFLRQGIELSRTTLCSWVMQCAAFLKPLYEAMHQELLNSRSLHCDATGVAVLAPDHTHRAYLWGYCGDADHPLVLYDFTWTQNRAGPKAFLGDYQGYLQADAHSVYDELYKGGQIVEVGCWAHARRKFFEAQSSDGVYAKQALERIRAFYLIERQAKGLSQADRCALRKEQAQPLLDEFFEWSDQSVMHVLPESPTGKAFDYALNNRKALERYCEDGSLDIDNNEAERALRSVVVGRKNWMFAGSKKGGEAAAIFFSLIGSAKRAQVNVFAYMRDILERLAGHPITRLSEFFPQNWKQSHPEYVTEPLEVSTESDPA